jgi:putative redox protein
MATIATTTVESTTGYANQIEARSHRLTADEAIATGGTDIGPTPYELLLGALGACTSITLRMYADRKGWKLGTIRVALAHTKHKDGSEQIEREIAFSETLSAEQLGRIAEIAEKTPVTKTIKAGAPIATRFG